MSTINKETLEYVVGLSQANTYDIGGVTFTDKKLIQVNPEVYYPSIKPLEISTLYGILAYINGVSDIIPGGLDKSNFILHIISPLCIKLTTSALPNGGRNDLVISKQSVNNISKQYQQIEEFLIEIETLFADNEDKKALLSLVSNIKDVGENIVDDNGISQNLMVKKSIGFNENIKGKNRFILRPFRTFLEVDQPESEYLLRVKKCDGELCAKLFFIENNIWQIKAIMNINNYFINSDKWDIAIPILA